NRAAAEIGRNGTRSDSVDRDTAGGELLGEVTGEDLDGALHRCVGTATGQGKSGQARGNVHDAAAVLHERQKFLRQEEHPFEVDAVQGIQLLLGGLFKRSAAGRAGIVDEIVESV